MDKAIVFGKYDHLMGIVNFPNDSSMTFSPKVVGSDKPKSNQPSVAMILLTAGMLHNAGPFRMYVNVADDLAKHGIPSLRFDLSGIGESLGVGAGGKSIDRAANEAIEAMDYLSSNYGIDEFILFGLCSGADDSMQTALKDERVKGVIAIDGLGYQTLQSRLKQIILYSRKMLSIKKWLSKASQLFTKNAVPVSLALGSDVREFPESVEEASLELQMLNDRNTQLHFIYTGGTEYYHYKEQFYDMFPMVKWKGNESVAYFPQMDHVAILCEDRKQLVDNIVDKTVEMVAA